MLHEVKTNKTIAPTDLRSLAGAVHIATDFEVAKNISEKLNWAADTIEHLTQSLQNSNGHYQENACGCGKPGEYLLKTSQGNIPSCNKVSRCPSYKEIAQRNNELNKYLAQYKKACVDVSTALQNCYSVATQTPELKAL